MTSGGENIVDSVEIVKFSSYWCGLEKPNVSEDLDESKGNGCSRYWNPEQKPRFHILMFWMCFWKFIVDSYRLEGLCGSCGGGRGIGDAVQYVSTGAAELGIVRTRGTTMTTFHTCFISEFRIYCKNKPFHGISKEISCHFYKKRQNWVLCNAGCRFGELLKIR